VVSIDRSPCGVSYETVSARRKSFASLDWKQYSHRRDDWHVGTILMSISHDVVVVGGGGAGLRAAIAVAELDPTLRIAIVSKVYPMRSHTVSAEGGAAAVISADDSVDEHAYDTISGGDWLCDQDAVEIFVRQAPQELLQLEHWGCPWNRTADGRVAIRACLTWLMDGFPP
jgi:succinate dehydrogenase/fumarate reductase flavoprotein subunit